MATFPLKMHIPPDKAGRSCLTLPARQWRRLPDGGIDVVFNSRDELELCVTVTAFLRDCEPKEIDERSV